MRTTLFAAILATTTALTGVAVATPITVTGTNGTATVNATSAAGATSSPFALADFGNANTNAFVSAATITRPNYTVTFANPSNTSGGAGLYDGNVSNVARSAYTGTSLTPSNYLVAEPSGGVTISYNAPRNTFELLWGSVDSYNSVTFNLLSGNTSVGSVTVSGSVVEQSAGIANNVPAFVTINTSAAFTAVSVASTTAAFEFVPSRVPEPASLGLLGAGLAGLGMLGRLRRSKSV